MILTNKQHRGIAKLLCQKAEKLPAAMKDRANRMRMFAGVHMALARAQDNNPALAPKPRSDRNQQTPSPSLAPTLPGENGVVLETMATRQHRLSEFDQGAPPSGRPLELLCEDNRGTYVLPYQCRWSDGAWLNADTGSAIEVAVLGWREA